MTKEFERSALQLRRMASLPLPTDPVKLIELVLRYVEAEMPIPIALHGMVGEACHAWVDARPKAHANDDFVYHLVHTIKLWELLNKREGSKRPLEDAFEAAQKYFKKDNARDIYKATSKHYKPRKTIVSKAKIDAVELFNQHDWESSD